MAKNKTKNKMVDLNNHLFEQLERLGDDKLKGEKLKEEINRAKAMQGTAQTIINNAHLAVNAAKVISDNVNADFKFKGLLGE